MPTSSVLMSCLLATVSIAPESRVAPPKPLEPVPSPQQLAWQEMEYGMFCHFGVNTFLDQEWGHGTEDPDVFAPAQFNARQWVEAAKAVGMKYLIVTAKHHDGFCLFPSSYTKHSVKYAKWRGGNGDVVREVSDACHELGIMFGVYLSPWDRHEPTYDDFIVYDRHFKNQLRELLTQYGAVGEVWFDGAGSKGHEYDWQGYYQLIRELQPNALIAICGPDIRWVGNEDGLAPDTVECVQERDGKRVWYPPECDVPIRKGQWFFHTDGEKSLRTVEEVLDIYYKSVGRGAVLLLNVSPDRRGLLPEKDVEVLKEAWRVISDTFSTNLCFGRPAVATNVRGQDPAYGPDKALDGDRSTYWATDDDVTSASMEVSLNAPVTLNRSMVQEHIALGQHIQGYSIDAWKGDAWQTVVSGTTIGHKRLDRFPSVLASKVRLNITSSLACPAILEFGVYHSAD